jgi:folate-binding protein YgfZ
MLDLQLAATREGALILEPPLDAVVVTGKDRVRWLNGMVTCDVAKVPVGGAAYGLHVGKTGKIAAEMWIVVDAGDILCGVPAGRAGELVEALDRYLIMEDCVIGPAPGEWAFALALGPRSGRLAEEAREAGLRAGVGRRAGGDAALIAGEPRLLEPFLLAVEGDGRGVRATAEGWERVRVELGIGAHGVDFDGSAYPQEAAVEADGVSFSKGCYLGQEAVFMMQERGHPPRRLVQLEVEGGELPAAGASVATGDGTEIGHVSSRVLSGERVLALATVKWKHAKAGSELKVNARRAVVTPLLATKG